MKARNPRLRIAFARIAQETNALSPLRTTTEDFRAAHFVEGAPLLSACGRFGNEAPGFLRNAELSGFVRAAREDGNVDAIPILSAWAIPAGPLTRACFDELAGRLADGLRRARPLDGVFLALHGAMGVDGLRDPEAELVRIAREASGAQRVSISLDLHGNVPRPLVERCDAIVAYATNPHRDHSRTGHRAGSILIRALRGEIDPVTAWRSLPMLLGGAPTIDILAPMRAIFRRARAMERNPRVLATSVFSCHPWNDSPDLGWSTVVIADRDRALAESLADELAEACWAVRDALPPHFPSPSEALATARESQVARKLGVVVLADASDVVTAGSTGDSTHLVRAMLEGGEGLTCYAAIRDAEVARALRTTPIGSEVQIKVGGKLDPERSEPLVVEGVLAARRDDAGYGDRILIDLDPPAGIARAKAGRVRLVVTEGPAFVIKPSFYTSIGLSMRKADVVMVKNFFPFRLFFLPWARKTIYVKSRGLTDFDAAYSLTFDGPMHPRDRVDDWRIADRRRRGV